MQKQLIHIWHPNLIPYQAVAVEEERPNIKFLVVEESMSSSCMSLRNLTDRIGNNNLLMQFFSEKTYLWKMLIQCLKAIDYLNSKGVQHLDINPNNIVIKFNEDPENANEKEQFSILVMDFLNIKELGEIAMNERNVSFNKIITPYDPPEKLKIG